MGFSILPASIAPSALPAPTIVCISSMKRTILPSALLTSVRTALSRSSNSPRNFAPARRNPFQGKNGLVFKAFPVHPRERFAGQGLSTIAVFSNSRLSMSTGLFLVFRERIRITRRISASRPMTGSSLPDLACSTRSMPYFLSARKEFSGVLEVTFCPPSHVLQSILDFLFRELEIL